MTTTQTTETAFPAVTSFREHAACNHGPDLTGYVVAYTRFDAATGTTSFEDIAYIEDATEYQDALDIVHNARNLIERGEVDATYAVIHNIYKGGHRLA